MSEMRTIRLDASTADRLLSGTMAPDDAPPGYAALASMLEAAAGRSDVEPCGQEAAIVAEMLAVMSEPVREPAKTRRTMNNKRLSMRAAALSGVVLIGAGSAAAAAAGSLPGAAQSTASSMLEHLGISVAGPNGHSAGHADSRGPSSVTGSSAGNQGKGPNAHSLFGRCTAAEAHTDAGVQPNAPATVFPSPQACALVMHPGKRNGTSSTDTSGGNTTSSGVIPGSPQGSPQGKGDAGGISSGTAAATRPSLPANAGRPSTAGQGSGTGHSKP